MTIDTTQDTIGANTNSPVINDSAAAEPATMYTPADKGEFSNNHAVYSV